MRKQLLIAVRVGQFLFGLVSLCVLGWLAYGFFVEPVRFHPYRCENFEKQRQMLLGDKPITMAELWAAHKIVPLNNLEADAIKSGCK